MNNKVNHWQEPVSSDYPARAKALGIAADINTPVRVSIALRIGLSRDPVNAANEAELTARLLRAVCDEVSKEQ